MSGPSGTLWALVTTAAVLVAVLFVFSLVLSRVAKQKLAIAKVVHVLIFEGRVLNNPGTAGPERESESQKRLRRAASELHDATSCIPAYRFWAFVRLVLPRKNIADACSDLIALSNAISPGKASENMERSKAILVGLKLPG